MWDLKSQLKPVVGALATMPRRLKENLNARGVNSSIGLIQKSALLRSARIIGKVLEL